VNYFQLHSFYPDEKLVSAWESQVAEAANTPWLAEALASKGSELFPRFAARYRELRCLPRGARRALQHKLARYHGPSILPERLKGSTERTLQHKLAGSLAGAALLLALGEGAASAATIKVNTKIPEIVSNGKCSLIEAIENANDTTTGQIHTDCAAGDPAGADTIKLPKNKTITLAAVHNSTFDPTGLPVITSEITIEGKRAKIVRDPAAPAFRLMAVSSTGDLTLKKLTLSGGYSSSFGGGIFTDDYATLTIENSTISGNSATYGGGIFNYRSATLTITNSTISGNSAAFRGGGIYNDNSATLTIENSTISGNSGASSGGGIYNDRFATLTINNSTISGNSTGNLGGGIFNDSFVAIENSTISGNSATSSGGGIYNYATLTFRNSLISGNTASISGPEVYNRPGTLVTANDFNLFGVSGFAGVSGFSPGATDIVPAVPLNKIIGPLKKNGGPTKTHALVKGSPALNVVPLADPECTGTDQRGRARPKGAGCDIGSFEK
jgi:hypothetical protein